MTKLLKLIVLLILLTILTSCSFSSVNQVTYTNGNKIQKDNATIFLSLTNSSWAGSSERIALKFKNLKDNKTYNIERQICESKVYLGLVMELFIKQPKDAIQEKRYCGNISVGTLPEGKYILERIWIRSFNESKSQNNWGIVFKPAKIFDFSKNNTYYLGNIDIKILNSTLGGYIFDLDLRTKSNLSRDTILLKKYYSSVKNKNIHDVSFTYSNKYREYDD